MNETLDQVDWNQMGRIGKIVGIFAAVIVAQILIKGILDTINLLPVVLACSSCSALWWWPVELENLTTSDKRSALVQRVQSLRQEYLGWSQRSEPGAQTTLAPGDITASEQLA